MKQKKNSSSEQDRTCKKTKSIKVLYSNLHTDRLKISMEGKWLKQIGFQIGDRLHVDVFKLMGTTARTLCRQGMEKQVDEMTGRIFSSGSYREVLFIIGEYVGAGREIVNWLIEQAKKKGITKIYLETPECGCSLYQEMGFTDVYGYMQIKDKSVF